MKKFMYLLLPALALLSACMTPAVRPDQPDEALAPVDSLQEASPDAIEQQENLDPFLLPDAEMVFRPRELPVIEDMQVLQPLDPAPQTLGPPEPELAEDPEQAAQELEEAGDAVPTPQLSEGFQVQLFASTSKSQAEEYRDQALYLFPGELVQVVWDAPNYKVRVGMFARREDADVLRRQALHMGYRDAWIVRSRVEE